MEGAAGFFSRLNPRERALLILMICVFALLILATFYIKHQRSLSELEDEISDYRVAIDELTAQGPDFVRRVRQAETIDRQLSSNELQRHSFIERQCLATSVDPPSRYDDTNQPLRDARTGQARITEVSTIVDIQAVDALPLNRLLNRIAASDELVLLKFIEIQPARGQRDRYRVRLTVSTFREDRESR